MEMPLRSLGLHHCKWVSDSGLERLQDMRLESLGLECCSQVTDVGVAHLKRCPLKDLELSGCQVVPKIRNLPLDYMARGFV